jgi:hypothetical protein
MATTSHPATELDFDQLKSDIIAFIKTNPTFTDYNFEGSALNAIVDILAYNTHTNAYYANMVHNEGFLDTAQKRSSVVSKAKELGYVPRSVVCSTAYLDITLQNTIGNTAYYLPRGTVFTSTNDSGTYQFVVSDTATSTITNTGHLFSSVKVVNGTQTQNRFTVNTASNIRSIFSIPNKNIDISTLKVRVRDSISSVDFVEYFLAENVYNLTPTSNVFFIQESYDGLFQIYFGGDVIGTQPINGNIIEIDYIVSGNYATSDGCRIFGFDGNIGGSTDISIVTTQVSFGGADKEVINSIKVNALKANQAKDRAVTISDYEILLKRKFNFIKSVSVWGGETHLPPVYGKVFISIQPVSGYTVSDYVKNSVIYPVVKSASLMTITPEFVDPTYTELSFITKIKFNQFNTTSSQFVVESAIKSTISNYISSISTFNKDYLESTLISKIVGLDSGIISVSIDKHVGFKMTPILGIETNHIKNINNEILGGSISSTKFKTYTDSECIVTIAEIVGKSYQTTNSSGVTSTIQSLGLFTEDGVLVKDIGTVNLKSGQFNISFGAYSYLTNNRFIYLKCALVNADITTALNQILILPTDTKDSAIGLSSNNITNTEIYVK